MKYKMIDIIMTDLKKVLSNCDGYTHLLFCKSQGWFVIYWLIFCILTVAIFHVKENVS